MNIENIHFIQYKDYVRRIYFGVAGFFDDCFAQSLENGIEGNPYKKRLKRYSGDRALLLDEIIKAKKGQADSRWNQLEKLLPELTGMKNIYQKAPLYHKQS